MAKTHLQQHLDQAEQHLTRAQEELCGAADETRPGTPAAARVDRVRQALQQGFTQLHWLRVDAGCTEWSDTPCHPSPPAAVA